ncbi:MAG: tRNA (N6-isopentenyl adenosine(37)-C2)-methylthiotransferase MiaB, partial [candidate division Zixibacteria bacterium RBG_16_53_22]
MNEYDSELVRSIMLDGSFEEVADPERADIVLLNTCAVREHAHNRIYGRLQMLGHIKKRRDLVIGVLGCMAQNLKMELLDNNLHVDVIAGPDSYRNLPRLIGEVFDDGHQALSIDLSEFELYDDIYPARKEGVNAWIAVMRGCDNFCTFCVVPYTRGRERSRPLASVVDETRMLVSEGYSQVTLLGQNVNSYEHEGMKFADLMRAVADVPGIRRVRFTSPHPKDLPDDLLDVVKSHPHVCKHIHLPLQAGNDRILKMMRRLHTGVDFVALADRIRETIPGVVLTTDVIVGFPTETREEFMDTARVMERVGFDSAFIFVYSERKGTVARRRWKDDVPPEEKSYRSVYLNDLQKDVSRKRNEAHIGQVHEIMVEGPSKKSETDWFGRNDGNKMVI